MRSSEAPLLKRLPSEYMREMFYTSQPLEYTDAEALAQTFRMIDAETQLMYSSDYPHWDFDLPAVSTTCRSWASRPSATSSVKTLAACSA